MKKTEKRDSTSGPVDVKPLAVVMCTHNHPSITREVLEHSADDYKECGIDIYYFDSSNNEDTKAIIEEYNNNGYDNIIYVHCPGMDLYKKVECALEGAFLSHRYLYVWPSKDRCTYNKSLLKEILGLVNEGYDAFHVNNIETNSTEYDSAVDFYKDWGGWVTSLNTTIYSADTLLKDFKGQHRELNDDDCMFFFDHYYYFFDCLSHIEKPRIKLIDSTGRINMSYIAKPDVIDLVTIWKEMWFGINDALPELYAPYKDYVIRTTAAFPWLLADRNRLLEFHANGILIEKTLPLFQKNWERISKIPIGVIRDIALDTYDIKYDISQISGFSELTDILANVVSLLRNGILAVDKVPLAVIRTAVLTEIKALCCEDDKKELKTEVAEKVLTEIIDKSMSADQMANHIQQLISLYI